MRTSKFSKKQINSALAKLSEGMSAGEVSKEMGVTVATVYNWKKKYRTNQQTNSNPAIKNKRSLEEENFKLKQLIANLMIEKQDLLSMLEKRGLK